MSLKSAAVLPGVVILVALVLSGCSVPPAWPTPMPSQPSTPPVRRAARGWKLATYWRTSQASQQLRAADKRTVGWVRTDLLTGADEQPAFPTSTKR